MSCFARDLLIHFMGSILPSYSLQHFTHLTVFASYSISIHVYSFSICLYISLSLSYSIWSYLFDCFHLLLTIHSNLFLLCLFPSVMILLYLYVPITSYSLSIHFYSFSICIYLSICHKWLYHLTVFTSFSLSIPFHSLPLSSRISQSF